MDMDDGVALAGALVFLLVITGEVPGVSINGQPGLTLFNDTVSLDRINAQPRPIPDASQQAGKRVPSKKDNRK